MVRFGRLLKIGSTRTDIRKARGYSALDEEDVRRSRLFDADWYLERYPDVAGSGIEPFRHFMRYGWREKRDPNNLFNTAWYLETYPEVRAEGCNPLLHYIRHGALERRDTSPAFRPSIFQDPRTSRGVHHLAAASTYLRKTAVSHQTEPAVFSAAPRVLIIAELSIPQCRKYRVDQKSEMLRRIGYRSTVLNWHDAAHCKAALATHTLVFFYRVPAVDSVLELIALAKARGMPTFWEVDDLIFDPNTYLANTSLRMLSPEVQLSVLSGVPLYRAAMLACDEAIASTRALAQAMRDAGVAKAYVIENALDEDTLKAARRAVANAGKAEKTGSAGKVGKAGKGDDALRIVYGSGTNTHDQDFVQAAPAVLAILEAHPQVKLRIIGDLGLPEAFAERSAQIERYPTTSYQGYLELMAECDIAIAPLEPTLFNDAKSNIKYIEGAMVGLPSVCSPRAEFSAIIVHGHNGLLASNQQEWFGAFERLIESKALREAIGNSAQAAVLARYDAGNIARTQLAPIMRRFEQPRKALRILAANVFFEPRSFGGATIVAEQMAHRLNDRDDTELVVFTSAPQGSGEPYGLTRYNAGTIPVFAVCVPETHDPLLDFDTVHTLHAFREVLQMTVPDVVHLHSIQSLGAQLVKICKEEGVPVAITLHDAWWICGRQFMLRADNSYCFQTKIDLNICSACVSDAGQNIYRQFRLRQMLEQADLLLTPSRFFHDIYAANGYGSDRLKVNRNGVARPVGFRRRPSDKVRFGFVGGNSDVKGARLIRKVFAELGRADYELVLVDNLTSLGFSSIDPVDWPMPGDLTILPAYDQSTMDDFWAGIDVLLFPTQWKESFGLTVREALIRDIWVIATDAGGVVEDIVDDENGKIIPLLDDGRALKAAVERALDCRAEIMSHCNPYKADIADHEAQAAELHGYLKALSLMKNASSRGGESKPAVDRAREAP